MKIGIIGLGSIGRRHAQCLIEIGINNIIALRSFKGELKETPNEFSSYITEVFDIKSFIAEQPDGVIISNPSSLHVTTLRQVLKFNIPTFVEKPLAINSIEILQLEKDFSNLDLILVGYCMRFHLVTNKLKTLIQTNKLGKVYKGRFYFGYYLPKWHPNIDYRKEYMSRKDLGGGVIRTLSHELDLVQYLLGPIKNANGYVGKTSNLELDRVDDSVFMNCFLENEAVIHVELDFSKPCIYERRIYIR